MIILNLEPILVHQGGSSLGIYDCGVFKTLNKDNIKLI